MSSSCVFFRSLIDGLPCRIISALGLILNVVFLMVFIFSRTDYRNDGGGGGGDGDGDDDDDDDDDDGGGELPSASGELLHGVVVVVVVVVVIIIIIIIINELTSVANSGDRNAIEKEAEKIPK
jgi:uncharacterized membrane protein